MVKTITLYGLAWACISVGAAFIIAATFFGVPKSKRKEKDNEL